MNHLLSEMLKFDIALVGANQNGALTSRYFALQPYRKCVFVWLTGGCHRPGSAGRGCYRY
jgi:hypothetical protein